MKRSSKTVNIVNAFSELLNSKIVISKLLIVMVEKVR